MCWSSDESSGIVVSYCPPSAYDQWPSTERKKKWNFKQPCKERLHSISIKSTKLTSKCKIVAYIVKDYVQLQSWL